MLSGEEIPETHMVTIALGLNPNYRVTLSKDWLPKGRNPGRDRRGEPFELQYLAWGMHAS